ncbi:hypothetical protein [Oceanimonas smirnovii]|uniref:hypothetical protein n=1 Tax=Oceanimonas smirnovii TaxID=264574 RepID=UPI00036C6512|nr:hypothetical protein [Oceanimonas smirnovii]
MNILRWLTLSSAIWLMAGCAAPPYNYQPQIKDGKLTTAALYIKEDIVNSMAYIITSGFAVKSGEDANSSYYSVNNPIITMAGLKPITVRYGLMLQNQAPTAVLRVPKTPNGEICFTRATANWACHKAENYEITELAVKVQ